MGKKTSIAFAAVAVSTLALSAAAPATSLAAPGRLQNQLIHYDDIDVSSENPRFLEPCIDVLRGLRLASQLTGTMYAQMSFTYMSRDHMVTKESTVALRDFVPEEDGRNTDINRYEELKTWVDIGDDRVNAGQEIAGTVKLVAFDGLRLNVMQEVTISVHVD